MSELHTSLNTSVVDLSFFHLDHPKLGGVSQNLFDAACQQYTPEVVASVRRMADPYSEDCVKLTQTLLFPLAQVLSRQRGKQYGFGPEAAEPEYLVFDQVAADRDIDQTPTNNLAEEQACSDQDARLAKKGSLKATSRDALLKRSLKLLDEAEGSFRYVSCATIRHIKL